MYAPPVSKNFIKLSIEKGMVINASTKTTTMKAYIHITTADIIFCARYVSISGFLRNFLA
ncbi:hypothetical protein KDA_69750 [Dictyobacter alpinus]|uniref:Uncharacterized protein n=1 Tax=Dictyobacter alpinus TaxID=2014873 RepID=A0A402BJG1_9CHLR|nr:hypothetical protein KDA_69750 [Dictyobacter alpinus]